MLTKTEIEKEEKNLKNVIEIIKEQTKGINIDLEKASIEADSFKKYIWNECQALATSDTFDQRYEFMGLLNEAEERQNMANRQKKKKYKLLKSLDSPYFGKIVFNNEDIYIGINGIEKDFKNYVYDWRSNIASMYYNYGIGKASYKTIDGTEEGTITSKRQFKIENSKLKWCIENSQNIEDEILGQILSKSSTEKMSNIVNTIQKEQNQIIRNEKDNVIITEGVAGSGKTEIALHRIAYLLYNDKNLTSNNVLIFSPNDVFTNYISGVLPELSEENVLSTTFNVLAQKYIDKNVETYTNFLDRVYNEKLQLDEFEEDYINNLQAYLKTYINQIEFRTGLVINKEKFSKEKLNELIHKYNKLTIMERINNITSDILNYYHLREKHYKIVNEKLISILNNSISPIDVYNSFLTSLNKKTINEIVYYNHIAPLLYTTFYINDYPYETNIRHIVIDEAQDYSLFQMNLIKKIFPKASFTILGDIHQNLNPFISYSSLSEYGKIFDSSKYIKLDKAYRSTKNIMDYASNLLNIKTNCIRENGSKVIIKEKEEILEDIKKLNSPKIGIITKSKKETENIYNLLKNKIKINSPIIDDKIGSITVLPIYIAKGLEFDSVIVYNSNSYDNKLLYVAISRAQNNLIIYK